MSDEKSPDVSEEIKDQQENAPVEGAEESQAPAAEENVEMSSPEDAPADSAEESSPEAPAEGDGDAVEQQADADMLKMLEDLPEEGSGAKPEDINFESTEVGEAEFQQLSHPAGQPESRNIEMLMDVNLPVSIELGRTRMAITDILALGPGSVVELNKLAGEPVDVMVNGKAVAKGEVVVIDENFGVRVTQLLTAEERLRSLGDEL